MVDQALTANTFLRNPALTAALARMRIYCADSPADAVQLISAIHAARLSEHQFPSPDAMISGVESDGSDDAPPLPTETDISTDYLLRHDWERAAGATYAQFVDPIGGTIMPFLDACELQDERDVRDYVAETARARELDVAAITFGTQPVPNDYRIFNRMQPDGTYRPLSEFFNAIAE